MSTDQLESRLSEVERSLKEIQQLVKERIDTREKHEIGYWTKVLGVTPEQLIAAVKAAGHMTNGSESDVETTDTEYVLDPYQFYIRQTGKMPPDDWKPGDPVPEPEHWK